MVTRLRPKNRLGELMRLPGGTTFENALAAAKENLESMRGESVVRLDQCLDRMHALGAELRESQDATLLRQLYDLAKEIVSLAGLCGMAEVGEAAYSLCDVLDGCRADAASPISSITVHLNGIKLLRSSGAQLPPEASQALLEGLRQVASKPTASQG